MPSQNDCTIKTHGQVRKQNSAVPEGGNKSESDDGYLKEYLCSFCLPN